MNPENIFLSSRGAFVARVIEQRHPENRMIKLVVALGNPDRQYLKTRHNIACQFIEHLPFYSSLNWQKKFKGEYAARR